MGGGGGGRKVGLSQVPMDSLSWSFKGFKRKK